MERRYTVAVDTREQLPYVDTRAWEGVKWERHTLSVGDYAIAEDHQVAAVERKSLADFYGCLARSRRRYEACLGRLALVQYPLVVVEADMADLLRPFIYRSGGGASRRSQLPPLVAQNSLLGWMQRYRVPFLLCGNREAAAKMTLQHLGLVWRHLQKKRKEAARDAAAT